MSGRKTQGRPDVAIVGMTFEEAYTFKESRCEVKPALGLLL
jgi:hypothetical protein